MAIHQGVTVQYKTNNGSVPAITLRTYTASNDTDATAAAADRADLLVLGTGQPTRLYAVVKDSATTEAGATTAGKWWIPA